MFGPDCDEHLRHLVLRDWLRGHPEDRDRYAAAKYAAAAAPSRANSGATQPWAESSLMEAGLPPL